MLQSRRRLPGGHRARAAGAGRRRPAARRPGAPARRRRHRRRPRRRARAPAAHAIGSTSSWPTVPADHRSAAARLWGLPRGPAAVELARTGSARPAPLVRDDTGGVLVGRGEIRGATGSVHGEALLRRAAGAARVGAAAGGDAPGGGGAVARRDRRARSPRPRRAGEPLGRAPRRPAPPGATGGSCGPGSGRRAGRPGRLPARHRRPRRRGAPPAGHPLGLVPARDRLAARPALTHAGSRVLAEVAASSQGRLPLRRGRRVCEDGGNRSPGRRITLPKRAVSGTLRRSGCRPVRGNPPVTQRARVRNTRFLAFTRTGRRSPAALHRRAARRHPGTLRAAIFCRANREAPGVTTPRMRRTAVTAVFLSLGLALTACGSRVDPAGTGGSAPAAASCVDTSGSSIKIGFLNSLSGTMAISENTVYDSLKMAVRRDQRRRRRARQAARAVVAEDGASEADRVRREGPEADHAATASPRCSAAGPRRRRKAMLPVFEGNNSLLFYPVQYEGLESSPNIFYTGATTNQQIVPGAGLPQGAGREEAVPGRQRLRLPAHRQQDHQGVRGGERHGDHGRGVRPARLHRLRHHRQQGQERRRRRGVQHPQRRLATSRSSRSTRTRA